MKMNKEEIKFQVALSCIQGVLEAKHGIIGEIVPSVAVAESLRIADEFVKQWFNEEEKEEKLMEKPKNLYLNSLCHRFMYGREMKDELYEATWIFPNGIKEKLKDDEKYFVWYDYRNSLGSSLNYTVYYIERAE